MKKDRDILFDKLKKQQRKYAKFSSLDAAELTHAALNAIECWEQTGGREMPAFHRMLDVLERTIDPDYTDF